jgi:signal transduction histidine kinase
VAAGVTVRARFVATVVASIAITVALFATSSIFAVDRALRSSLRARLTTSAQAISSAIDVHHGKISVDAGDLRALASIHASTPFAIFDPDGKQIAGDVVPSLPQLRDVLVIDLPVDHAGSISVWQSNLGIADFDRDAAVVSIGVGLLLVGLGVVLARRAARTALAPLENIASLAEQIEGHDLSRRLRAEGERDELSRLCASFDRMLDRLQHAFDRERQFVADASHEFRAPLAVLRAETELALRRQRSNEEYCAALESVAREAARMEDLVDELLAAARAEIDAAARQPLDAAELSGRVAKRVEAAAAVRGVAVELETNGPAVVPADEPSIERALLAIVHNAIAHARENGVVRLRVASDENEVRIDVTDDGPGFSAAGLTHATERFWRGNAARPRGSTGLGLAIARAMVEASGGALRLANQKNGGGACVTLVLPTA